MTYVLTYLTLRLTFPLFTCIFSVWHFLHMDTDTPGRLSAPPRVQDTDWCHWEKSDRGKKRRPCLQSPLLKFIGLDLVGKKNPFFNDCSLKCCVHFGKGKLDFLELLQCVQSYNEDNAAWYFERNYWIDHHAIHWTLLRKYNTLSRIVFQILLLSCSLFIKFSQTTIWIIHCFQYNVRIGISIYFNALLVQMLQESHTKYHIDMVIQQRNPMFSRLQ